MKSYDHIARELLLHSQISTEVEPIYLGIELVERVCGLEKRLPTEGVKVTHLQASNYFMEAKELYTLAEYVAIRYGIKGNGLRHSEFDYEFATYEEFHELAQKLRSELDKIPPKKLPDFIVQDMENNNAMFATDFYASTRAKNPAPLLASQSISGYIMSKILAGLGIKELTKGVIAVISGSGEWGVLMSAWKAGDRKTFINALKQLMRFIFKGKFLDELIEKVGESAARRVFGTIAGRFVPFLGWALIIGGIIWAIYEEA